MSLTFDEDEVLLDEFDVEELVSANRNYVRSYSSRRASFEPDYDYDFDDYPYGFEN